MNNIDQSENKYVNFVNDEHLLKCISHLYYSYVEAKREITKKKFYKNKIDTIKLTFDSKFNDLTEDEIVDFELSRQIDKSVNNAIGTFHEEVLGGVNGYSSGKHLGYDLKADDNALFAEIKNKHNTMSSSAAESSFQRLARFADNNKLAECFLVQIWAKKSFVKKWAGIINGKEYSHSRVNMISGDKFYEKITGREKALFELYQSLPKAIEDFLKTIDIVKSQEHTLLADISNSGKKSGREILNEITFENFFYYSGFEQLRQ
ncbi:MAG: Eco47II family restriction endonuclease [Aequorivita sp.]|nr:Eco47II family restriction endonuclease [Aequorivita sp.]